jgi:hypothetical protein
LNSDVNARLGRGDFLPLVAMLDILSGAEPLMVDVRQSGSRSSCLWQRMASRRVASLGGFCRYGGECGYQAVSIAPCQDDATRPQCSACIT